MIRGGKSYVSAPPAFSNDAKRILVCTGSTVSVFSTSTGLQITSLEDHKALVTSVIVVPASSPANKVLCFCWTASLDGTIRYWDFSVPELMKSIDIKMPIYSMVIPSIWEEPAQGNDQLSHVFAYLSVENLNLQEKKTKTLHGQICKCNLTKSRMAGGVILGETPRPQYITVSPSGKFFGILNKHKLLIWKVPSRDSERLVPQKITLHHTKSFTVHAFHPTNRIVAAGDVTGRILIWRGFGNRAFSKSDKSIKERSTNNDDGRPGVRGDDDADSCTTWHWHPAEVNVLSFSSDGAYLYSGGREGVLVVWQLDTGKKKYLPRIGSPLLYFKDCPDPSMSSISCADNQIHILKMPSMEILKSISGIKLPCSFPEINEACCAKLAFDQSSGIVALRAANYSIQLYSLFDDREKSEVQVCERNHQPGDEVTVVVTSVALSHDGSLMSTTEVRVPEEGIGGLVCLKFWSSGSEEKNFSLSTIIYDPHRDAGISAVVFHPIRHMAVSTSYGGDFKIWVCNDEIQQKREMKQNSGWICHAVGSYKKKPMTAAAFSADGSVLAIAADSVITLWDPDKNILVAVIREMQMQITMLCFVGNSEHLVSVSRGSKPLLTVWSMSKLSVSWSYKLLVEDVACALDLSSFAVLVLLRQAVTCVGSNVLSCHGRDGVILLFDVTDPVPVAMWSVKKANGGALAFVQGQPSLQGKPLEKLLAYMNGDHEYIVFDPYGNDVHEICPTRQVLAEESGHFGYESIYGELPEFEMRRSQTLLGPSGLSERPWETIFSGSSHNLPPLTKICSAFLESLLEKRMVSR